MPFKELNRCTIGECDQSYHSSFVFCFLQERITCRIMRNKNTISPYAQLFKAWRFQQIVNAISVVLGFKPYFLPFFFVQIKVDFGNTW